MVGDFRSDNATLYDRGRRVRGEMDGLVARGVRPGSALRQAAGRSGLAACDARAAVRFAGAVDAIVGHAGPEAKALILGGHPLLPHRRVMQISRTHPDRQRFALTQVAFGRHPFAKPQAGTEPPFDTVSYGEVVSRLARSAGLLRLVARVLADLQADRRPAANDMATVRVHLADVLGACAAVRRLMRRAPARRPRATEASRLQRNGGTNAAPSPRRLLGFVPAARGLAEKNVRDLPRLLREQRPTADERARVLAGARELAAAARTLTRDVRSRLRGDSPRGASHHRQRSTTHV
jgi:hypothetical protein